MLEIITNEQEVSELQALLQNQLVNFLHNEIDDTVKLPFEEYYENAYHDEKIWFAYYLHNFGSSHRYWNAFGVLPFSKKRVENIVVEICIPVKGINRKVQGVFARDSDTKEIYLLHRGFVKDYKKPKLKEFADVTWVELSDSDQKNEVILVTSLTDNKFGNNISDFVNEVHRIKHLSKGTSLSN